MPSLPTLYSCTEGLCVEESTAALIVFCALALLGAIKLWDIVDELLGHP